MGLAIKGVGYKNTKQSLGAISEKTLETSSGMHQHKHSNSKAGNNSIETNQRGSEQKQKEDVEDVDFEESKNELENILRESLVNNIDNIHDGYHHQAYNHAIQEERDEGDSGSLVIHEETINRTYEYDRENDNNFNYTKVIGEKLIHKSISISRTY